MLIAAFFCLALGLMVQFEGPFFIDPRGLFAVSCHLSSVAFAWLYWRRHRNEERDQQSVRAIFIVNMLLLTLALFDLLTL